jgi:hypothetical protein
MAMERHVDRVAGVLLLLLAVLTVGGFLTGATLGEVDPFARDDVEELLRTINGSFGLWAISLVAYIATDVLAVAAAACLYVIFHDRSPMLSLLGALSLVAAAICFMLHEVGATTLAFLAQDFLEAGGAASINAGDPVILATARAASVSQALTALFGQTLMGLAVASFGAVMVGAPAGVSNPPRWIGVAGLLGGAFMLTTWTFVLSHVAGGAATLIAELAVLVMLVGLGVWLLRHPAPAPARGYESLAPARGALE